MYHVLDTFIRAESPARLSWRWSRLVRQLSDTPFGARSTVNLPSIRPKMFPRTHVPRARHLPPGEIANSVEWRLEASCTTTLWYTTSGTIDRQSPLHTHENVPTDTCTTCSTPSAVQKSPTRLSWRWSRLVRQLSDTPPGARSTVDLRSIRTKMFPRTHVPRARHLPPDEIANSVKWRLEATCTTTLWYTTSGTIDRQSPPHTHENVPTDTCTTCSTPSAGQKSPTRLSFRWGRLVRQLSDTPPRARSTDNLHFIRPKMCPRTHVPCARHLPPDEIANSVEWRLEATCTTTLWYTTSGTIDRQSPPHTHENVPTDTCTPCSTPSAGRNRQLG